MKQKNFVFAWIFFVACVALAAPSIAQNKKSQAEELPPQEDFSIDSTDGVTLKGAWYPGTNGKETVPIILVHDLGDDKARENLLPLAEHLQKEGHAVIVPDLRGHGASKSALGVAESLEYSDFKKSQIASMVIDIDTCKRFLMRRNNAGELNIEMLTVVATHRSTIHAVNWVVSDWAWPPLLDGTKQGQDVKALFLISPVKRYKSNSMTAALKAPCMNGRGDVPPVIFSQIYGRDDEATSRDADSIESIISKGRVDPSELEEEEAKEAQTSFMFPLSSSGVGNELLKGRSLESIKRLVSGVIQAKLADKSEDFQWQDRSSK